MLDRYIEKSLLYLVAVSAVLHFAVFAFYWFYAEEPEPAKQEPYFVELEDLTQPRQPKVSNEAKRKSDASSEVRKETAPKGEMPRERIAKSPPRALPPITQRSKRKEGEEERILSRHDSSGQTIAKVPKRGGGLLKERRNNLPELARLFPGADRLAVLEDSFRKKYGPEVAEGETKFLDTNDIMFGSFLRRFEDAVYGVWRYPREALRLGIEGDTPVRVTFNKRGEIENVELLESSGSKILDNEAFRILRMIGPVGSLPKGYNKEKFKLIVIFQHQIVRGISSGTLH